MTVPSACGDIEAEVDVVLARFSANAGWPVCKAKDGARYLLTGVWSTGEQTYEWQHGEAALFDLRDCPFAREMGTWRGEDVRDVLAAADPDYDGEFWKHSGKTSFVVLYRVEPGVPLRLKRGTTWRTGGGRSEVAYREVEDYTGYRHRSREVLVARGIDPAAPKLAREKREAKQAKRRRRRELGW